MAISTSCIATILLKQLGLLIAQRLPRPRALWLCIALLLLFGALMVMDCPTIYHRRRCSGVLGVPVPGPNRGTTWIELSAKIIKPLLSASLVVEQNNQQKSNWKGPDRVLWNASTCLSGSPDETTSWILDLLGELSLPKDSKLQDRVSCLRHLAKTITEDKDIQCLENRYPAQQHHRRNHVLLLEKWWCFRPSHEVIQFWGKGLAVGTSESVP